MLRTSFVLLAVFLLMACHHHTNQGSAAPETSFGRGTYGYDAHFLEKYGDGMVELRKGDARVLLSSGYQGRVFTSTAAGDSGASFGWINYGLLSAGQKKKQFNPVGGEERFWIGPEGGQYAVYFPPGDSFNIRYWQVPGIIDTTRYTVEHADSSGAAFHVSGSLVNYSGTRFEFSVDRTVSLLSPEAVGSILHTTVPPGIKVVAYETDNRLTNTGSAAWRKSGGLLSIWLLGQFTPTEQTKVIIPFSPVPGVRSYITDDYFGKIDSSRLMVRDSVLYFRCDGKSRGKLGLKPVIAKPFVCSYDFEKNVLTILVPEVHKDAPYVNSKWQLQKEPYNGDVINSYNDGPLSDGTQLGPFYEIESSSPVYELKPGEQEQYRQITLHLQGSYEALRSLLRQLIRVDLDDVKKW